MVLYPCTLVTRYSFQLFVLKFVHRVVVVVYVWVVWRAFYVCKCISLTDGQRDIQTDIQTDRMDGQMDRWMDRHTDRRKSIKQVPACDYLKFE